MCVSGMNLDSMHDQKSSSVRAAGSFEATLEALVETNSSDNIRWIVRAETTGRRGVRNRTSPIVKSIDPFSGFLRAH